MKFGTDTFLSQQIETDEKASKPQVALLSRDDIEVTSQHLKEVLGREQCSSTPGLLPLIHGTRMQR